jgi:rare lipoprotein A
MVTNWKSRNMSTKTPLRICLMAGVSSVILAAVVVTLSSPAVQADALLPQPIATTRPAPPVASVTPASLAPQGTAPRTATQRRADILHGVASWYGGVFNGRRTASGEVFNMHAMTACHPTLPFGSLVRVRNRNNKRSVVVRITDRGDLVDEGRVIDLSYAAAKELAMTGAGLARVDLQVISLGRAQTGN